MLFFFVDLSLLYLFIRRTRFWVVKQKNTTAEQGRSYAVPPYLQ